MFFSIQKRFFKKHTWDTASTASGRSVNVTGSSPIPAYQKLKDILFESKFVNVVRNQERFERPCDIRRRKRKEQEWKTFMNHVRLKVTQANRKKEWDTKELSVDRWVNK
jgi:hypothetical protein